MSKLQKLAGLVASGKLLDYIRLGSYASQWVLPRHIDAQEPRYLQDAQLGHQGFDLNEAGQLERLRSWRNEEYRNLWNVCREDPAINASHLGKPYIHNGYYPTPDAEIYASMILDKRPDRIIEVGSGYSTLIARHAVELAGLDTKIQVVDPNPRTNVREASDDLLLEYVEDVDAADLAVGENDLLFIDSSHICRGNGDIPRLFCQLIPKLPKGALVHIHDIFTPYEYPAIYLERLYTEQYVLHALLAHSSRYRVLLSTYFLSRQHTAEMQATFGDIIGEDSRFSGASFWFEVTN